MKLASVYFDDTVCIPGGKDVGGGLARQDLRDSCFHAADGWEIVLCGNDHHLGAWFRIWREGMQEHAFVGGYGFTYTLPPLVASEWPGSEVVAPPHPASASPKDRDMADHVDAGAPLPKKRRRK